MKKPLLALTILFAAAALPPVLSADEFTYSYVGPAFVNSCGNCPEATHISGFLTLGSALPADFSSTTPMVIDPITYSFTDGLTTITPLNVSTNSFIYPGQTLSFATTFDIYSTNAAGDITNWSVDLVTQSPGHIVTLETSTENVYCCAPTKQFDGTDYWTYNGVTIRFVSGNWNLEGTPGTWNESVQATATPEPSFFFLIAAALLVFAAAGLRRNIAQRAARENAN